MSYLLRLIILALVSVCIFPAYCATWQLQANESRPLRHLCNELQDRFGWLVTYEEGPYSGTNIQSIIGNNAFIPKPLSVSFESDLLGDPSAGARSFADKSVILNSLVKQVNAVFNIGAFRVVEDRPYLHIQPFLWSNDGKARAYQSFLDNPVTLKSADQYPSLLAMLEDILGQINKVSVIPIGLGSYPTRTLISQQPLFSVPAGTSARSAILQVFKQVGLRLSPLVEPVDRFFWEIVYDPSSKGFFFNIDYVRVATTQNASNSSVAAATQGKAVTASPDQSSDMNKFYKLSKKP